MAHIVPQQQGAGGQGAGNASPQPSPLAAAINTLAVAGTAAAAGTTLDGPAMALLRLVCLATGAVLHVAPWPTFNEIRSAKSTLNYHVAPYASTLVNHLVNGYYAGIRGDYTLILHRAVGISLNLWYVWTFLRYCPPARLGDTKRFLRQCVWVIVFIVAELHFVLPLLGMSDSFGDHLALIAAITGIAKAASPLATVREVIAQGDSSSLPLSLCFVMAIQCAAWTVYGYVKDDWSTGIHNGVGAMLGAVQLSLIWYYPNKRKLAGAVEMSTFSSSGSSSSNSSLSSSSASGSGGKGGGIIGGIGIVDHAKDSTDDKKDGPMVVGGAATVPVALSSAIATSSSSASSLEPKELGLEEGRQRR